MNTKTLAVLLASIIAIAMIAPMAMGDSPSSEATVTNVAPYVCCKEEYSDDAYTTPIPSSITPTPGTPIPIYLLACVCDPNGNDDNNVMALVSPSLTLSDDEMGTQFAKVWGPGTVTGKTDVAGLGVQFDFTGLTSSGTGVSDDFPVSRKAGGAQEIYGYGDFSKYTEYSLWIENVGSTTVEVNLDMNTGWTEGTGTPERDTFWQNTWTTIAPGEKKQLTLDFSAAEVYGASDDPETAWQYADGTTGVQVRRLGEVSKIGFQVLGNGAGSIIVSAAGKVVPLSRCLEDTKCTPCTCIDPNIPCVAYCGSFDMDPCDPAGHWTVSVIAFDGEFWSDPLLNQFDYECLEALELDFLKVSFSGAPGSADNDGTFDTNDKGTITSVGNNPIDICVSGVDLSGMGTEITIDNMEADVGGLGMQTVPGTGEECFDTNLGCTDTTTIEAQLDIPSGKPAGTYTGTITITISKTTA